EICEFQRGLTISEKDQFKENIEGDLLPIIKIGNIQDTEIVKNNLCWLDPNKFQNIDQFYFLPGEILIVNTGFTSGKIGWNNSNTKYVFYSGFLKLKPQLEIINQKYLFYVLLRNQENINSCILMGVRPALDLYKVKKLKIPLPPLKQQEKIAKWLETFSSLERQLERHKTQYRYYLNRLMRGGRLVELKKIIKESFTGTLITKSQITTEGTPCIRYGEIYTSYDIWCETPTSHITLESGKKYKYCEKNDLLITKVGETISEIAKPLAYVGEQKILADSATIVLLHEQNAKYLAYALSKDDIKKQKAKLFDQGPAIANIRIDQALKLQIPLPSLEKQEKIANWLDRFRELTENISKGLPKEILLLKQQSRYYREKLIN
ncbi:hypothetical protein DNK47_03305, partial [Mycoplasma wenyonii]